MAKQHVVMACMDEDLDYGADVLVAGVGGSAIIKIGGGRQDLFPDEKRKMADRVRPALYRALKKVSEFDMNCRFGVSSHNGCGWAGAQEFESGNIPYETRKVCEELDVPYWGHIPHADSPVIFGDREEVTAYMKRHETEHEHGARSVIITVGGFITQEEVEKEAEKYGDAFLLTADWLVDAIENDFVSKEDAFAFLDLQVDIADGIADGVKKNTSVKIFDAGRLPEELANKNRELVEELMAKFE